MIYLVLLLLAASTSVWTSSPPGVTGGTRGAVTGEIVDPGGAQGPRGAENGKGLRPPPAFQSPLQAELVGANLWQLTARLDYASLLPGVYAVYPDGIISVPTGFRTDLASVPRAPLIYLLTANTATAPAVLHDFLYVTRPLRREIVDAVFYEAMKATGVPAWRRWIMWASVRSWPGNWKTWAAAPARRAALAAHPE